MTNTNTTIVNKKLICECGREVTRTAILSDSLGHKMHFDLCDVCYQSGDWIEVDLSKEESISGIVLPSSGCCFMCGNPIEDNGSCACDMTRKEAA